MRSARYTRCAGWWPFIGSFIFELNLKSPEREKQREGSSLSFDLLRTVRRCRRPDAAARREAKRSRLAGWAVSFVASVFSHRTGPPYSHDQSMLHAMPKRRT